MRALQKAQKRKRALEASRARLALNDLPPAKLRSTPASRSRTDGDYTHFVTSSDGSTPFLFHNYQLPDVPTHFEANTANAQPLAPVTQLQLEPPEPHAFPNATEKLQYHPPERTDFDLLLRSTRYALTELETQYSASVRARDDALWQVDRLQALLDGTRRIKEEVQSITPQPGRKRGGGAEYFWEVQRGRVGFYSVARYRKYVRKNRGELTCEYSADLGVIM